MNEQGQNFNKENLRKYQIKSCLTFYEAEINLQV